MGALLRLLEVELGAPDDDRLAMVDEVPEQIDERQDLRLVVDDREEDDPESRLHRGERVELVQHDLGVLAALQLDHDADSLAARLVAEIRDAFDLLVVDELRDPLDQLRFVDLVRDLGDDDRLLFAARRFLDLGARADLHDSAAGLVGLADSVGAVDESGGREVGARQLAHQLPERRVGPPNELDRRIDDLAQVVRRDVGRHADRDSGRAVDE